MTNKPPFYWFVLLGLHETANFIYCGNYTDKEDQQKYFEIYRLHLFNKLHNNTLY